MREYVYESMGLVEHVVRVGENAIENWQLVDRAEPDDMWFHVANYPSGYVVVSSPRQLGANLPKGVIVYCAQLCKAQSKQKYMKHIEIIYTEIRNVKKTHMVGEVRARKSKSIYV